MNLIRGEMEGTATAVNAVKDGAVLGTEGGEDRRCRSSTTTIGMSPRGQIVKKKKHTQLIRTPQTTPPIPAELLNGPPLLLPSHQPHNASTICESSAASCPRPALAVSHLCHCLKL